jgi:hypothetical protein
MAKFETPYCPECHDAFDYPQPEPVDRRNFLRVGAAGAAAAALVGAAGVSAVNAAPAAEKSEKRKAKPAEDLVRELYASLKDEQKKKVVLAYDDGGKGLPTRMHMVNVPLKGIRIGDNYTKPQQELIEKIVKAMSSGDDGYHQISREGTWDGSRAFTGCGAVIFGNPTKDEYAFVFSGHHLTIRCDGNFSDGVGFGGPMYYGHTPYGYSADNCFYYQTKAVVKLYKALSGKQQTQATVKQREKGEAKELKDSVKLRKEDKCRGIPAGELTKDQLALAEEVMRAVLKPFRGEDVDEVMAIVKKNGGMEKIRFGFYPDGATNPKAPWHFWRLEGPGFVWNYRVLDHVHTYVNISSKLT